jgi:DNA processing protein
MDNREKIARLRLARTDGVGPATYRRLIDRYGTAQRAIEAMPELSRRGGRAKPLAPASSESAEQEIDALRKLGGQMLVHGDDAYPAQLAVIDDAPMTLSVLGNAGLLKSASIGIVGSRNASLQGRKLAETFADNLGRAGLIIVSGLARGIDTAAHAASINTGTIAVVAGGVDVVYPSGAVIAENALGTQPTSQHFPRRNRIISGLSKGVVIVEGTLKSGSLITAHMAADQGREVFAIPGHPFDPRAGGPNALIRDGATLTTSAQDILDQLARMADLRIVRETGAAPANDLSINEPDEKILGAARNDLPALLNNVPVPVDDLIRTSQIPASAVHTILLELELAGRLTRHPGNRVSAPYIEYAMDKSSSLL